MAFALRSTATPVAARPVARAARPAGRPVARAVAVRAGIRAYPDPDFVAETLEAFPDKMIADVEEARVSGCVRGREGGGVGKTVELICSARVFFFFARAAGQQRASERDADANGSCVRVCGGRSHIPPASPTVPRARPGSGPSRARRLAPPISCRHALREGEQKKRAARVGDSAEG
jgi:hypothetical protein